MCRFFVLFVLHYHFERCPGSTRLDFSSRMILPAFDAKSAIAMVGENNRCDVRSFYYRRGNCIL